MVPCPLESLFTIDQDFLFRKPIQDAYQQTNELEMVESKGKNKTN